MRNIPFKSTLILTFLLGTLPLQAQAGGDDPAVVKRGERLFMRCVACHDVTGTPSPKIGPTLKGIVGRPVASVSGFGYSASLKGQSFGWDDDHLDRWLEKPVAVAPGTTMGFIGLSEAADRQALIAYLKTAK